MADATRDVVEGDFTIRNDKSASVDIFLIDRAAAEQFRLTVKPGATATVRSLEAESWIARIGSRKIASYTVGGSALGWRLYEDSLETRTECAFAIENRRRATVEIFRMTGGGASALERRVDAGATIVQESYEGERWAARLGGREIAAYCVTPRIPRWTIADAVTGVVPALPIGANDHLNEAPATRYPLYQRAVGEVKAAMVF